MSEMLLKSGWGDGTYAKIKSDGRLYVNSVSSSDLADNSRTSGSAYIFHTSGFISLTTTGAENGIFYLKNTSTTQNLELHDMRTCGTVASQWIMYHGDTGGTLISTANASTPQNLNRTSTNTASATCYYGADALTRSGGTLFAQHINGVGHAVNKFEGSLILGTNDSITLTAEVAAAGEVCAIITGHYIDK